MSAEVREKILMLRSSTGVFGAERVILELAKGLTNSKFQPIIGVLENKSTSWADLATAAEKSDFQVKAFKCRKPFDLRTALQIRKFIKEHQIATIHAHGYKANFYALMAVLFSKTSCVATCHPWTETDYSVKARLYTFLDKLWLKRMDDIVAVSGQVQQQLLTHKITAEVIPNGIDIGRFNGHHKAGDLRDSFGFSKSDIVIGTIGRLVPEKGYTFLLNCAKNICKKYSNAKFIFIGDGPLRDQLQQQVEELGLQSNVIFFGIRDDIPAIISVMNIFVLSSISEGFPMVLLEAMAAGKAIVATSVGEIPGIIVDGQSGLLVPASDSDALTTAVDILLSDKQKIAELATAAREEVLAKYSSTRMAELYMKHYEKLSF